MASQSKNFASWEEIEEFLSEAKDLVGKRKFRFVNRKEYKEVIPRLGIKPKFEILLLSPEDYIKGPCPDRDKKRKGKVWSFVKEREEGEKPIYIKLKTGFVNAYQCIPQGSLIIFLINNYSKLIFAR